MMHPIIPKIMVEMMNNATVMLPDSQNGAGSLRT